VEGSPGASKPWPETAFGVYEGRIRPALHALGAGRPNPLSPGLRLASPGKLNRWRGNLLLTQIEGLKKTGLGYGERYL
jgi:hypothetical protein